ncbi:Hypothetical predicted protein [Mytilus galloprovincialis]|uniref:IRG-type G domain-containing protein n=1 Tax=Mytilus galloprovincialis TaxID=29158 RepID=A0A8B6F7M8_MYTGA|nr:Hypothetical predicted protein [Mytilus galloprovincialis]
MPRLGFAYPYGKAAIFTDEDSEEAQNSNVHVSTPVTNSSENSSSIIQDLALRLKTDGLIATRKYLLEHVDKWKRAKVKIAVAGQSTAGKSSFINFIRGVRFSDKGYAKEGYGDTTQFVEQYEHPKHKQLVYCDLPGYGTTTVTRKTFLERVNISEYDMFIIFFTSVPTTEDEWLVTKLQEGNIPFCFVKTKLDQDIENGKERNENKEFVLARIKSAISGAADNMPALKDAQIFIISNRKPSVGQMPQLITFMQEKVIKVKFEAILFSIPAFTKEIIDKKYIQMSKRIQSVSLYHAFGYLSFDYKCSKIRDEITTYFKVFELDGASATELAVKHHYSEPYILELIKNFKSKMPRIVQEIVPIYSVIQKYKVCSQYLHNLLDELKVDAYALYMHETQNIQN